MYYRPRERKRSPLLSFLLFILLIVMSAVLLVLLGMYVGYFDYQPPNLMARFEPTPTPTRPAVLYIADGDTYFADGKLKDAIAAYEQAIRLDPDNDVPYIRQSRLLVYTRETAKAVERAAQAVIRNPDSPENLAYYCRALDWEARYNDAYDACDCAIELDPQYAEGYAFLSEVYADQGDWRSAVSTAQQALDANFQSVNAHHNMGYALEVRGRYAEAQEFYENAIVLAPTLAPLYVDAGLVYNSLGDYKTASERFKRAIKLNPTDPQAYDLLGWAYYQNGEYARAVDALEQSLGVDPTYVTLQRGESSWGRLGLVYYTRQNFEKAIEFLPKAIELGEREYLRRARQIEVLTEVQTLTGPDTIPVLRGRFTRSPDAHDPNYRAVLQPVTYQSTLNTDTDQTCGSLIAQSIQNESVLLELTQALTFTEVFSQSSGAAQLNLISGSFSLDLQELPPAATPYEIKVTFWPHRTETVGTFQPENNAKAQVNIQFEKGLSAPVEYYYLLGLSYAYLEPRACDQAVPWLLKSLKIESAGWSPAWYGLRLCPSPDSPPTPIPTFTPVPTGTPSP